MSKMFSNSCFLFEKHVDLEAGPWYDASAIYFMNCHKSKKKNLNEI